MVSINVSLQLTQVNFFTYSFRYWINEYISDEWVTMSYFVMLSWDFDWSVTDNGVSFYHHIQWQQIARRGQCLLTSTALCLHCCVGSCNVCISTRQLTSQEEWPRSHIYQCTHWVFPAVIDYYSWCTRWQLLWVSAQDLAADGKNPRIVCIFTDLFGTNVSI